jgi:hypothetical protein
MKFEDIRYAERDGKYGKTQGLYLEGNWVSKEKLTFARDSIFENQHNIDLTRKQFAASLLGSKSWNMYPKRGQKIALGRCVAFLVKHDLLPWKLKVANPGESGKRIYVTADTVLPPSIKRISIVYRDAAQLKQLTTQKKTCSIRARDLQIYPASQSPAS